MCWLRTWCITWIEKQGKIGYFVVKLDLAKSYENLSRNYVDRVVVEVSFALKLIQVVMVVISSVSISIRWNGKEDFNASKGLCQGDPISSYLFCPLYRKIVSSDHGVTREWKWVAIKASRRCPVIYHLMFVDISCFFGKAVVSFFYISKVFSIQIWKNTFIKNYYYLMSLINL